MFRVRSRAFIEPGASDTCGPCGRSRDSAHVEQMRCEPPPRADRLTATRGRPERRRGFCHCLRHASWTHARAHRAVTWRGEGGRSVFGKGPQGGPHGPRRRRRRWAGDTWGGGAVGRRGKRDGFFFFSFVAVRVSARGTWWDKDAEIDDDDEAMSYVCLVA